MHFTICVVQVTHVPSMVPSCVTCHSQGTGTALRGTNDDIQCMCIVAHSVWLCKLISMTLRTVIIS